MKALLFDPYSGASGDMIMGCLLDLGADANAVRVAVESVGCRLEISHEERSHILTTRARVFAKGRYRCLSEALAILKGSTLSGKALERALEALDLLASAESLVHGVLKEEAHFHEVGALDALADIAGGCAALESLNVEAVLSLPICVGGGFVSTKHGLLPVPGPAAIEILRSRGLPWRGGPVEKELLTPTGAALLAVMVDRFLDSYPLVRAERVGYGSGEGELQVVNALRGTMGMTMDREQGHGKDGDRVVQLETNVDDVTGEVLGSLIDLLMDAGALDVTILPAIMKKGRSGNVIRVIAGHEDAQKLSRLVMRETGTLGVRVFPSLHRYVAQRDTRQVAVEIDGSIHHAQVKVSRLEGAILSIKPEYEDSLRIARVTGLPLRVVIRKVEEEGWRAMER
ncbi:MAG TPA: nickel pincer cofactor biosynthesis protein LarC [Methanothrix sp.]|nr:nickel pincer cofactor biosynthesis protein LarC [Methanothrix sp.]